MHPDILWLEDDPFLLGLYIFRGELFKLPGGIKKNQRNKCSAIKVEWWNWKAKLIPTKKTKTRWWKAIWKTKLIPKRDKNKVMLHLICEVQVGCLEPGWFTRDESSQNTAYHFRRSHEGWLYSNVHLDVVGKKPLMAVGCWRENSS